MRSRARRLRVAALTFTVLGLLLGLIPATAIADESVPFADPAFQRTWEQADATVASGATPRSWLWGPEPIGVAYDYYVESTAPGRGRLVQYFDKARMEITHPKGDTESPWYVTNGLLVKELVSGQRQVGDNDFQTWGPAYIPVAGDLDDRRNIKYVDFEPYATLDGASNRAPDRTGQQVDASILPGYGVGDAVGYPPATYGAYEPSTGHNIADVFWSWMYNPATGISAYGTWVYPMGLPISEPYWTIVSISGAPQHVLVQLFERRVLTYTPSNPAAWQVEMGNVGAAYLEHFERDRVDTAFYSPTNPSLLAVGAYQSGNADTYIVNDDGSNLTPVATSPSDEHPVQMLPSGALLYSKSAGISRFSWLHSGMGPDVQIMVSNPLYSPNGERVAFICDDWDGICIQDLGSGEVLAIQESIMGGSIWTGPWEWSPDGTHLVIRRYMDDTRQVAAQYVADTSTGILRQIGPDDLYDGVNALSYVLGWTADSSHILIAVEEDVDGEWVTSYHLVDILDLQVATQIPIEGAYDADLSSTGRLAFSRYDEETSSQQIWTAMLDGSQLTRVTQGAYDRSADWNADGSRIVYIEEGASPKGAVTVINADGTNKRQIFRP